MGGIWVAVGVTVATTSVAVGVTVEGNTVAVEVAVAGTPVAVAVAVGGTPVAVAVAVAVGAMVVAVGVFVGGTGVTVGVAVAGIVVTVGVGVAPPQAEGRSKAAVPSMVLLEEPWLALAPKPRRAKAVQIRHSFAPPVKTWSAAKIALRPSTNPGEQG